MDRDIRSKNTIFLQQRDILSKNLEISSQILDSFVERIKNGENGGLISSIQSTFDTFTELFKKCNNEFNTRLLDIDVEDFDYPEKYDLSNYKVNTQGEYYFL